MRPVPAPKAAPVLNDRQRQYLLAAYELDQQIEQQRKRDFARGMVDDARTPAAQWRAMPYGRWQHKLGQPPTPLREALAPNLVSPGTGSTWKALAERGLVSVDDRTIQFPGMLLREQYELPHVSLTRAGRQLARQLLGEVRESAKPGVLAPDTWRALTRLWEWDPTQECYLLADGNGGTTAGIAWEVWQRLERLRPQRVLGRRNQEAVVENHYIRLTTMGRIYYLLHWAANCQAHPTIAAPDPHLSPETAQRIRALVAAADAQLDQPPAGAYDQWQANLHHPRYTTRLEPYERQRELSRGLPTTPAELLERPALRTSWRHFLHEYLLRQQLTPAEWSSYQLWSHVRLEKGRPVWQVSASAVSVEYRAAEQVIRLYFSDYPRASELAAALSQLHALAHRHHCGRWLLSFRGVPQPLRPPLRQRLVAGFSHTGKPAGATSLRIALVAPTPPVSEWAADLPEHFPSRAFEWAEFSGELAAYEWLAPSP